MATSQDTQNKELAMLNAHKETDIAGVAKVETNEGAIMEKSGLPEEEDASRIVEDDALPIAMITVIPPKVRASGQTNFP